MDGKMFLVKEFLAKYQPMGDRDDPAAPTNHLVILQIRCEVGDSANLQASPVMFLTAEHARNLGQKLLREAKAATEASRNESANDRRH